MKVNDKIIAIDPCVMDETNKPSLTIGKVYDIISLKNTRFEIIDDLGTPHSFLIYEFSDFFKEKKDIETPKYYDNTKGSLYLFAEHHNLNAYEFDIIKRIVRCRKKGNFKEDLEKTKVVIDLYLKEQNENRTTTNP